MTVRPGVAYRSVESITLSATEVKLAPGDTIRLTATVLPANAQNKSLRWEKDPTVNVVSIDEKNVITAVAPGVCYIRAEAEDDGGAAALCKVTVAYTMDGHDYVDLGLPSGTLWATCNIGASNPEDSGLYFAWGETSGYTTNDERNFNWTNYAYGDLIYDKLTYSFYKYNTKEEYGTVDSLTELTEEDDAACVNWSTNWRMPSQAQVKELMNTSFTDVVWTTRNNVNGYLITSKINGYIGNSIFLPAAGYRSGLQLMLTAQNTYWSRSLKPESPQCAYAIQFHSNDIGCYSWDRFLGNPVRPVTTATNH